MVNTFGAFGVTFGSDGCERTDVDVLTGEFWVHLEEDVPNLQGIEQCVADDPLGLGSVTDDVEGCVVEHGVNLQC